MLVGDTLLGKPLMEVFCRLAKHEEEIVPKDAALYFLRLVAVQAQGYAMLGKARQALGIHAVQDELFRSRTEQQMASFARTLASVYGLTEWNASIIGDSLTDPKPLMEATMETKPDRLLLVNSDREVLTRVVLGDGVEEPISYRVGHPVAGSGNVESVEKRTTFSDGNTYRFMDLLTKHYEGVGGSHAASYQPFEFIFEDPYVLVGLRFSTLDNIMLCEPLVAAYDRETGTTSWNGASGGLWKVTYEPADKPVYSKFWFGETGNVKTYAFYEGWQKSDPTTIRGAQFAHVSGSPYVVRVAALDGAWAQQSLLPAHPWAVAGALPALTQGCRPADPSIARRT
ncbi:hypothetical protein ACWZEH_34070 [Streptomyces sp. QTS137]